MTRLYEPATRTSISKITVVAFMASICSCRVDHDAAAPGRLHLGTWKKLCFFFALAPCGSDCVQIHNRSWVQPRTGSAYFNESTPITSNSLKLFASPMIALRHKTCHQLHRLLHRPLKSREDEGLFGSSNTWFALDSFLYSSHHHCSPCMLLVKTST